MTNTARETDHLPFFVAGLLKLQNIYDLTYYREGSGSDYPITPLLGVGGKICRGIYRGCGVRVLQRLQTFGACTEVALSMFSLPRWRVLSRDSGERKH